MTLEQEFNEAYALWREHCRNNSMHSMPGHYIDCSSFKKIVSLGRQALPFIRDAYATEQGNPGDPFIHWPLAIKQIVPEFRLPIGEEGSEEAVERRGGFVALDVYKVKQETIRWLEEYLFASKQ